MAKNTLENVRLYANKLAYASVIALSGAALAACSVEQQKPYCIIDDGDYIADPSVGVMHFGNSSEYIDDTVLYGEKSAKHYVLDTFVNAVNERLEPGTPVSVRVTSAETQETDSQILAREVAEDLSDRGLAIGRVSVAVQKGTGHVNPLLTMAPMCYWN